MFRKADVVEEIDGPSDTRGQGWVRDSRVNAVRGESGNSLPDVPDDF